MVLLCHCWYWHIENRGSMCLAVYRYSYDMIGVEAMMMMLIDLVMSIRWWKWHNWIVCCSIFVSAMWMGQCHVLLIFCRLQCCIGAISPILLSMFPSG